MNSGFLNELDESTGEVSQWSTPRPGADSYPMTPESQVHAGAAPTRVSLVRDPETAEALQRLV